MKRRSDCNCTAYAINGVNDIPATLDIVRGFGFTYVELAGTCKQTPTRFKELLDKSGLIPVSGHFSYEQFRDHLDDITRDAKTLGLEYAGCAWIPHQDSFEASTCREAIAVF